MRNFLKSNDFMSFYSSVPKVNYKNEWNNHNDPFYSFLIKPEDSAFNLGPVVRYTDTIGRIAFSIKFTNSCEVNKPFVVTIFQKMVNKYDIDFLLSSKEQAPMLNNISEMDLLSVIKTGKLNLNGCQLEFYKTPSAQTAGDSHSHDMSNDL